MNYRNPHLTAALGGTPVSDRARLDALDHRAGSGTGAPKNWLPLFMLPMGPLLFRNTLPAWAFMWLLAFGLYLGCKWLTWTVGRRNEPQLPVWRHFAYLFLWIGMDAHAFLDPKARAAHPTLATWIFAFSKTFFGAFLLWGLAGRVPAAHPLLTGWVGMIGIILLLHFGTFHLLALWWQQLGINARPLMRAPILADSLADFWGNRWNTAFQILAHHYIFRPLHRRVGATAAMLLVFTASGLLHDLLISVPAHGGYGLPTAYFLLQGVGVLFERSVVGRMLRLGHGWRGRLFTIAMTAGPAFYLFHPVFIRNVILPMLHAIGAT